MSDERDKQAIVRALKEYAIKLQSQISGLQEDLATVHRSIALFGGTVANVPKADDRPLAPASRSEGDGGEDYFNLGCTQAMLQFLRENAPQAFKSSVMANKFRQLGVKGCEKRHFANVVASTSKRLADTRKIIQEEGEDGVFVFRARGDEDVD